MSRPERLPRVWLGVGAVPDPAALARFADLRGVPVPVGPVVAAGWVPERPTGPPVLGVGGVEHDDTAGISVEQAQRRLSWCATHDLRASLVLRGRTTGELADVLVRLRSGVDVGRVSSVEVDLRSADEQLALKTMARVREAAPRGLLLLARLPLRGSGADLVAVARSAVAGGAGALLVGGGAQLGDGRWWSGPSVLAVTLARVRTLRAAGEDRRWPTVPLVAAGGVHDGPGAHALLRAGADAVQLGTALWADPTLLDRVREHLAQALGDPPAASPDRSAPTSPPRSTATGARP